jgi:hypothetical protein
MSRCHLDKLIRQNKQHVELPCIIVTISLGLDTVTSGDNKHNKPSNLQHRILLVILVEACITLRTKRPLIFNVFNDVLVFNALIIVNIKLVFNVLFVVINLDDAFDLEHIDQHILEEPDLDLLLDNDE